MIGARPLPLRSRGDASATSGVGAPSRTASQAGPTARVRRRAGGATAVSAAIAAGIVAAGWLARERLPLTPESGAGYALGVAGAVTIVLLIVYSARKRLRILRRLGPLSQWFRIHMMLGLLAPVLILFHCKFSFGAPNSNVALGSLLIVAASGVVGRYIYTRVSHGLYGARATLEELHANLEASAHHLGERLAPTSAAARRLAAFSVHATAPRRSIGGRALHVAVLPLYAAWVRRRIRHELRAGGTGEAARRSWDAGTRHAAEQATGELIGAYIAALIKEVQFSAYERLFSLWHALHVPLFIMLLLTGILHVIAVHMY